MAWVFCVSIVAVSLFSVEWFVKALIVILLLLLWRGSYQTYGLLTSHRFFGDAVIGIELRENQWLLRLANGTTVDAVLKSGSYFSYRLSVLNFSALGYKSDYKLGYKGSLSVVLFPDSADPEMLRRLRVRLNLGGQNLLG